MISKKCHKKQDWQRCGEGFSGLEHLNKLVSRKLTYDESESQLNEIEWNSSEDEDIKCSHSAIVLQHSNLRSKSRIRPKRKRQFSSSPTFPRKAHRLFRRPCSQQHSVPIDKEPSSPTFPRKIEFSQQIEQLSRDSKSSSIYEFSEHTLLSHGCNEVRHEDSPKDNKSEQMSCIHGEDYISDCESEVVLPSTEEKQEEITVISSAESLHESPAKICQVDTVKGTDWMRQIMTPTKPSNQQPEPNVIDSAKKKKKYTKGGLAEQLQKVLSREKSAYMFWKHQWLTSLKCEVKDESTKCLQLKLTDVDLEDSHYVCQSVCLEAQDESTTSLPAYTALISRSPEILPVTGDCITVHPPWQQLDVSDRRILFCRHITSTSSHLKAEVKNSQDNGTLPHPVIWETVARWRCPCMTDHLIKCQDCPSYSCDQASNSKPDGDIDLCCTQGSVVTHLTTHKVPSVVYDSILDCIENSSSSGSNLVSFQATILRVFCSKLSRNDIRWRLVVEDLYGCFCEVVLPEKCEQLQSWADVISKGEGSVCVFKDLEVKQRITKDSCPGLFTLIESLWAPSQVTARKVDSQNSTENECSSGPAKTPPHFCYQVSVLRHQSKCDLTKQKSVRDLTSVHPRTLREILQMSDSTEESLRLSCYAKLLCMLELNEVHYGLLYISDLSLWSDCTTPYITVQMAPDFCFDISIPSVILCRDILYSSGTLVADSYSQLKILSTLTTPPSLHHLDISSKLPQLTSHVQDASLVVFSGAIESVDEDSACTWFSCPHCNVELDPSYTPLRCTSCMVAVDSPRIRMNMEVVSSFVSDSESHTVKIKLLEKTILQVLPTDYQDQGCDIDAVLGKRLASIPCIAQRLLDDNKHSLAYFLVQIDFMSSH